MPSKQFIFNTAHPPNLSTSESFVMEHDHLNVDRDSSVPIRCENAVDHNNSVNVSPPLLFPLNTGSPYSPHLIQQIPNCESHTHAISVSELVLAKPGLENYHN